MFEMISKLIAFPIVFTGELIDELFGMETHTYKIHQIPSKKICDFCNKEADERLGSGLLCGAHYFLTIPESIEKYNFDLTKK